tara:strand:- start:275 stop:1369 length:1095 start_codon:yes stop_codon:yes gene_type:complete
MNTDFDVNIELSKIINLLDIKDDDESIIDINNKNNFCIHKYIDDELKLDVSPIKKHNIIKKDVNFIDNYVEPTPLKISTITAIAIICSDIDLSIISKYLSINNNIRYVEYAKDEKRGIPTKKISKKKSMKKKIFFNQATVVVNVSPGNFVNTKIFTNGKIQMTGLKKIDDGKKVIEILINEIKNTSCIIDGKVVNAAKHPENLKMDNFCIVLINTDFKTNFKINRHSLHNILVNDYDLFSKYEPCIYPGVDTKFYWNKHYNKSGKCFCSVKCNGKGYGNGSGDCKKITIAAFQSGSVIITGARNMEQVYDAYAFINKIFKDNFTKIKKVLPSFIVEDDEILNKKKTKYYYIKKDLVKDCYIDTC